MCRTVLVWLTRQCTPQRPSVHLWRSNSFTRCAQLQLGGLRSSNTVAQTDPLNFHGAVPAALAVSIITAMEEIGANRKAFAFPLLMFFGTLDKLINTRAGEQLRACPIDRRARY